MNVHAVKSSISATMKCYQEKLVTVSFLDAKLEMKRNIKLFSYVSMTGLRGVDDAIILEIENASRAKSWKVYYAALQSALDKIERYHVISARYPLKKTNRVCINIYDDDLYNKIVIYVNNG